MSSIRAGDRRRHERYQLALSIRARTLGGQSPGTTLNISTKGVLFRAPGAFTIGHAIELLIEWPTSRPDNPILALQAVGRIVRVNGSEVAARIERAEFHILGKE